MDQIKMLNDRCDNLQSQITAIEDDRNRTEAIHKEKAQQSLLDRSHFNFVEEETQDESDAEGDCGRVPKLRKCESKRNGFAHNMKQERF